MKVVADTNIFLAVALDEPEKEWIIPRTVSAVLLAPAVLPYEIGNALSAMVRRDQLLGTEALEAHKAIQGIPTRLLPVDVSDALKLAASHCIYAYDAYFLQCARQMSCPLLTLDRQMIRVARTLGITLLE